MHASIQVHTRVRTHVCPPTHIIARRGLHPIMRTYGHAQMHGHTHTDTHKCAQTSQPIPFIFTSSPRRERRLHPPAPREGRGIVILIQFCIYCSKRWTAHACSKRKSMTDTTASTATATRHVHTQRETERPKSHTCRSQNPLQAPMAQDGRAWWQQTRCVCP